MASNTHVLITRPEPACWQLQQALVDHGFTASCQPLLNYQQNINREAIVSITQSFCPNIIVFISQAAVECAHNAWPLTQWISEEVTVVAVGRKTQATLAQYQIPSLCPERHDSEGMFSLPCFFADRIDQARVLIVRGDGGREWLAQQLCAAGAKTQYLESYRRNWLEIAQDQHKIWKKEQINVMVITSEAMLNRMCELLPANKQFWFSSCLWIVPSQRVAAAGAAKGLQNIIISEGASDRAIISALQHMELNHD